MNILLRWVLNLFKRKDNKPEVAKLVKNPAGFVRFPEPKAPTAKELTDLKVGLKGAQELSDKGVEFIVKFEGFSSKAFWDYKQWSIGFGTKAKNKNEVITRAEGKKRLQEEANKATVMVQKYVTWKLKQHELDALVSFTYNVGHRWMTPSANSGLMNALKARKYETAMTKLQQYVKAGGKVNKGLVRRRGAEAKLFLEGVY